MDATNETVVWEGGPSQLTNFGTYLACTLVAAATVVAGMLIAREAFWVLIIPILVALWCYLELRYFRYTVTTERVGLTRGVLTKRTDSIELYRVKDTTLIEPFFLRMFGLADVVLSSSDRTTPLLVLHAVPDGLHLREEIRANVERLRVQKAVREVDFAPER
ncbi:MAG TPA: PH domain-containing protein [Casimicrobiaceae bacterium]